MMMRTCAQVVGTTATATVAFWLGGPLAGVIVVLTLFVALVCAYGKQHRRCWSRVRPANPPNSNDGKAECLLEADERTGGDTKHARMMSLEKQKHAADIEMANRASYRAPQIEVREPATSAPNGATTWTNDILTSSAPGTLALAVATDHKLRADGNQSDTLASSESSLLGCEISSPSSNSADAVNEPMRVLEPLPENEPIPPVSEDTSPKAGSTTDEEHYYASDEYSTSSEGKPKTNPPTMISLPSPVPSFAICDVGEREESLGTLFATSSSEGEPQHCIKRPRLPSFGKGLHSAWTSAVHQQVLPRNTTKAGAPSSESEPDNISEHSI